MAKEMGGGKCGIFRDLGPGGKCGIFRDFVFELF